MGPGEGSQNSGGYLLMPTLVLKNIGFLITVDPDQPGELGSISQAALVFQDDKIAWLGKQIDLPNLYLGVPSVDCQNGVVMPGLIDCHTHVVFAGTRLGEFVMRARGATYAEIMQAGGGIRNTTQATREASVEELTHLALPRLSRMLARGVTSIEAKTGYGLSTESELKMLEVMRALELEQPIEISPTFLGAHAVPPEYEGSAKNYVDDINLHMLPQIAEQGIATACDVFVEKGAFSVEQARSIFETAKLLGLKCRVHAEQLSHSGGALLAAEVGALSASHLEFIDDNDRKALAQKGVVAELLPIAQEFLGMKQLASGRALCEAGVKVAIGTDLNPGSSMCDDLHLAARLAVTRGGLTCEEAVLGVTRHAACALGRSNVGMLRVGLQADVCVMELSHPFAWLYDWSTNPVKMVFKKGKAVTKIPKAF